MIIKKNKINKILEIDLPFQEPNSTEKEVFLKLKQFFHNNYISSNIYYIAYPWANIIEYARKEKLNIINYLKYNNFQYLFDSTKINITTWQYFKVYNYINLFKFMNIHIIFSPHAEKNLSQYYFKKYNIQILPIFLIPIINPKTKIKLKYSYPLISKYLINLYNTQNITNPFFLNKIEYHYSNHNYFNNFLFFNNYYQYSFIGNINYPSNKDLSKKRFQICNILKNRNDCYLKINDKWHLDNKIYGEDLKCFEYDKDYKIEQNINEINYYLKMKNTKYPIVPLGMGPNSFRVTESIAFGKVPIIISDKLWLPKIKNYNMEDYSIIIKEKDIPNLNYILDNLNQNELQQKQNIINIIKNLEEFNNLAYPIIEFIKSIK